MLFIWMDLYDAQCISHPILSFVLRNIVKLLSQTFYIILLLQAFEYGLIPGLAISALEQ